MMPLEKEVQAIVPLLSSPTNSTADQPSSSGQQPVSPPRSEQGTGVANASLGCVMSLPSH